VRCNIAVLLGDLSEKAQKCGDFVVRTSSADTVSNS